jgi:hypothetical protein
MATTSPKVQAAIEYALMVVWDDGDPEYIPANDASHAEHMARTIYAGRACFTVGREIQPWRFVNRSADELSGEVAR